LKEDHSSFDLPPLFNFQGGGVREKRGRASKGIVLKLCMIMLYEIMLKSSLYYPTSMFDELFFEEWFWGTGDGNK
jgi:hypothetical protein